MPRHLIWHGHGTFEVVTDTARVMIDPFFTGNPSAIKRADEVNPDVIIVSHGHGDHVGDAIAIAKRRGALLIANHEISLWARDQGASNVHGMHIGGSHTFPWGTVKLTMALHGSMLPDGSNGGNPCGVLLRLPGATLYHACDTGLFGDMALIGEEGIDVAILPIGDNYTMGPDDALRAVRLIKPRVVIPDHFGTWPLIAQDANVWCERVRASTETRPVTLTVGQPWNF